MGHEGSALAWALLGIGVAIAHCGGPAKERGRGEECFRAVECLPGLVCIEQKCTDDLSSVNIRPDAGASDDGGVNGF